VFELCGVKTNINGRILKLIALYRPSNPDSNSKLPIFFSSLEDLLETTKKGDDLIVAGDLNIDILNQETSKSSKLINIFKSYELSLLNPNQITRLTNGTDGTLIDHVFSNLHENSTFNIIENNISDHLGVMVELNIKLLQKRDIHKFTRSYKEENWSKFIALLLQEEWHYLYSQQDVDKKKVNFL
jgi:hypothetical protein